MTTKNTDLNTNSNPISPDSNEDQDMPAQPNRFQAARKVNSLQIKTVSSSSSSSKNMGIIDIQKDIINLSKM